MRRGKLITLKTLLLPQLLNNYTSVTKSNLDNFIIYKPNKIHPLRLQTDSKLLWSATPTCVVSLSKYNCMQSTGLQSFPRYLTLHIATH